MNFFENHSSDNLIDNLLITIDPYQKKDNKEKIIKQKEN